VAAPRTSIVITNYNYERFLHDAIDSALRQTDPNREVIVVDDGSTDGSARIISSYGHEVRPILKTNGGMASGYNAGFRASRGGIVLFLDSDDMLLPTAVAEVVRTFDQGQVAKVHWPLFETNENGAATGNVVPRRDLPEGDFRDATLAHGPDAYLSPPTSGNAWSRAFLERVLPMPEADYRQHADAYLTTLAPLFGAVRCLAAPQAKYRVHRANDYATKPADEKNRRNLAIFERRCQALSALLQREGIAVDPEAWKSNNPYHRWMQRLDEAAGQLRTLMPPGTTFILVDEDQWADRWGGSEVIAERRAVPFLERNGQYWGPPADDATAVSELLRLRDAGAEYIAFAWPAFWWLEHYAGLNRHLRENFCCVLENDGLVVFDLRN
jgi:glycosyltransferase involved in cell wall biosynthesis